MFKISNGQASAFSSPIIVKLFSDEKRQFPIEDAFKLSDMIQSIQSRLETYRTAIKKIIDSHQGKIADNGFVTYPDEDNQRAAGIEIEKLNAVEIECPGELISPSAEWPKLTLAEASILRPLLNGGKITPPQ